MKYRGGCAAPQLLRLNGCRWPERRVFGHFSGPSRQASLLSPVPATGFDPRLTNVCVVYTNVIGTIDSAAPLLSPRTYMHTCTNIHHDRLINLSCTHPTISYSDERSKTRLSWFPDNTCANKPATFHLKNRCQWKKCWFYLWFLVNKLF